MKKKELKKHDKLIAISQLTKEVKCKKHFVGNSTEMYAVKKEQKRCQGRVNLFLCFKNLGEKKTMV